jgi:hypothetical protein
MIEVKIAIGTVESTRLVPSGWQELSPSQFVACCAPRRGVLPVEAMQALLNLNYAERLFFMPVDWYALFKSYFKWLDKPKLIKDWLLSSLTLTDGREVFPPSPDFDNVTWEEFIFVEQLAFAGNWEAVAATLFRPLREPQLEDEDDRIPFSRYGTSNRLSLFKLSDGERQALSVNYLSLRHRLTRRYPYLFTAAGKNDKGGDGGAPQWVEVTQSLLGDTVWNERQLLSTSVSQVLYRLNQQVKESRRKR